jgi:hypothetical protein
MAHRRAPTVVVLMALPLGCQDSDDTHRHLSFAQVDAVRVGWSRELIIQKLGPPHEEQHGQLRYSTGLSDGGYYWSFTYAMDDGIVLSIRRAAYCGFR